MRRLVNIRNFAKLERVSVILIISSITYVIIFIAFYIYANIINTNFPITISDQAIFTIRGQGILQGKIPYRDFPTDAAPLSPYLWAPFVFFKNITGIGLEYSLRIFFAICLIAAGWVLYRIELMKKNEKAALISLLFTINPFFLYLFSFWGSDECLVPLLILLPIYFFEKKKYALGTLLITLGAGLKYFPILLAPLIWYYTKTWKQRAKYSILFLISISTFVVPFLILCKVQFLNQFRDPSISPGNQGIVTILGAGYGIELHHIPEIMRIIFLLTEGILALVIFVYQIKKSSWNYRYTAVFFLVFLILYKKIQESYIVTVLPFATSSLFEKRTEKIIAFAWYIFAISFGEAAFYLIGNGSIINFLTIISWIVIAIFYILSIFYIVILLNRQLATELNQNEKALEPI